MKNIHEMDYKELSLTLTDLADEYGNKDSNNPFKGRNFFTNHIIAVRKLNYINNNIYFEISYGRGIYSKWMVGVSFVKSNGDEMYDESSCCHSIEEIKEVFNNVLNPEKEKATDEQRS